MDLFIEKLLGFVLVLTRLSAMFLVAPIFGSAIIPPRIKIAATVLLSIFFCFAAPFNLNASAIQPLQAGLLICNEAIYGLAMGLIAAVLFTTVRFSGRIIERQMGLAMAQVMDPFTGERTQPLGSLLEMIFIIIFLAANGHHILLKVIMRSYESFPAGSIPTIDSMTNGVIDAGSTMFIAGLRLAAPTLAAFLILLVVLAVLARVVPEMNILFISLPMRVMLGLFMAAIFIPFIAGFVSEFSDWMEKLLPL